MTLEEVKRKWAGVQSVWKDGCYFFSLLTILDELGVRYDLWEVTYKALAMGWVRGDGYVAHPLSLLEFYAKGKWKLEVLKDVPANVADNQYTVEKWQRDNWTHFKRRFVDTLLESQTVKKGKRVAVYLFTRSGERE